MNWYKKIKIGAGLSPEKQRRMPETEEQMYDYFHSDDCPKGEPGEEDFLEQCGLSPKQKIKRIFKSKYPSIESIDEKIDKKKIK